MKTWSWSAALVILAALSGCGGTSSAVPSTSVGATTSAAPSTTWAGPTATTAPVPDAAHIARLLLAMPAAHRPVFLDPYGTAIGGDRLGLGPTVRVAGYRADPLFICIQHVDMKAGRAGAWTAYAVTKTGAVESGASSGACPPAPGRPQVRE